MSHECQDATAGGRCLNPATDYLQVGPLDCEEPCLVHVECGRVYLCPDH
jgi:hypothetical protein